MSSLINSILSTLLIAHSNKFTVELNSGILLIEEKVNPGLNHTRIDHIITLQTPAGKTVSLPINFYRAELPYLKEVPGVLSFSPAEAITYALFVDPTQLSKDQFDVLIEDLKKTAEISKIELQLEGRKSGVHFQFPKNIIYAKYEFLTQRFESTNDSDKVLYLKPDGSITLSNKSGHGYSERYRIPEDVKFPLTPAQLSAKTKIARFAETAKNDKNQSLFEFINSPLMP